MFSSRYGARQAETHQGELSGELRRRPPPEDNDGGGKAGGGPLKALALIAVFLAVLGGLGWAGNHYVVERLTATEKLKALTAERDAALEADGKAFDKALADLGYDTAMEPRRLGRRGGLERSREILGKTAETVARYRAINEERIGGFRERVLKLKLREDHVREFLRGYDERFAQDAPLLKSYWDRQEAIVEEGRAALDVLARNRGAWMVDGERMMFYNGPVMASYNRHIETMNEHVRQFRIVRAKLNGEPAPLDAAIPMVDLRDQRPR